MYHTVNDPIVHGLERERANPERIRYSRYSLDKAKQFWNVVSRAQRHNTTDISILVTPHAVE